MAKTEKKVIDRIFMLVSGIFGFFIMVFAFLGFNSMSDNCTNSVVYDSLSFILVIGTIITTMSLTYFFCAMGTENCYTTNQDKNDTAASYLSISLGVSAIIFILCVMIISKISKDKSCFYNRDGSKFKNSDRLKFSVYFILSLSILSMMLSGYGLHYINAIVPAVSMPKKKAGETAAPAATENSANSGIRRTIFGNNL